jgi:hypothetical protein
MLIVEFKTLDELKTFAESAIAAGDDFTSTWVFDKAVEVLSCFPIYYVSLPKHPVPWDGHDPITRSRQMAQIRRERLGWCMENVQREEEKLRFFCAAVYGRFFFLEYSDAFMFHLIFG